MYGAIDVGTNAARLKLVRPAQGELEVVHDRRDPIRPGEGVFLTGAVQEAAAGRLIATLRQYAALCGGHRARVRAVATSALREAVNREEIVARVREHTGIELEVISGEEEARLICLGVLAGTATSTRSLCIDIGGGSTELVLASGERPRRLWSIRAGGLRLTEVSGSEQPTPSVLRRMRETAASCVRALPPGVAGVRAAIGCSGTVRSLVAFVNPEPTASITREQLGRAVSELVELGPRGRRRRFSARRAEVIVAGAVILEAVMDRLGLDEIAATKLGLRDGILVDLHRAPPRRRAPRQSATRPSAGY
jgi:exopolyphosphatase/guanosine-5'-triphosphate,3'-diphosphate pyrophosphatase